eukprot:168858_1
MAMDPNEIARLQQIERDGRQEEAPVAFAASSKEAKAGKIPRKGAEREGNETKQQEVTLEQLNDVISYEYSDQDIENPDPLNLTDQQEKDARDILQAFESAKEVLYEVNKTLITEATIQVEEERKRLKPLVAEQRARRFKYGKLTDKTRIHLNNLKGKRDEIAERIAKKDLERQTMLEKEVERLQKDIDEIKEDIMIIKEERNNQKVKQTEKISTEIILAEEEYKYHKEAWKSAEEGLARAEEKLMDINQAYKEIIRSTLGLVCKIKENKSRPPPPEPNNIPREEKTEEIRNFNNNQRSNKPHWRRGRTSIPGLSWQILIKHFKGKDPDPAFRGEKGWQLKYSVWRNTKDDNERRGLLIGWSSQKGLGFVIDDERKDRWPLLVRIKNILAKNEEPVEICIKCSYRGAVRKLLWLDDNEEIRITYSLGTVNLSDIKCFEADSVYKEQGQFSSWALCDRCAFGGVIKTVRKGKVVFQDGSNKFFR